jgi:hypothetical protein
MYTSCMILETRNAKYPLRTISMFTLKLGVKYPLLNMSVEMLLEGVFPLKWAYAFGVRELLVAYANKTDRISEYHWVRILDNLNIIILNQEEGPTFVLRLLNILSVIKHCLEKPRFFPHRFHSTSAFS